MATVQDAPPRRLPDEQTFVLTRVSWGFYEHLLEEIGERRIRVTYDRGTLELMSPSQPHERNADVLGSMVRWLCMEFGMTLVTGGSVTMRREDIGRGIEADRCFWIANAPRMYECRELDLTRDPPPDLAIEVDITHSSLDRMGVYAALGVPEVWRWVRGTIQVNRLGEDGRYAVVPESPTFPGLPMSGLAEHLWRAIGTDEAAWGRSFVDWLRREVVPRARPGGA